MPLLARTRQGDRLLAGGGGLLERCRAAGLPVASACDGRGACGRCIMTIHEGADSLLPPEPREADLLTRLGATATQRLGCQVVLREAADHLVCSASYW